MTTIIAPAHLGLNYPLDYPRVCYHKADTTVTASGSADGADPAWLDDGETWSIWQADAATVTVDLTFSEATDISYVGIAAHTLDLAGSTVEVLIDTGAGFATAGIPTATSVDDSAILFLFNPVTADAVRLSITGTDAPQIAVAQAGLATEIPRRSTYIGKGISESEQVSYRHAKAVRGGVLSRVVQGAELSFSVSLEHLSEDWRRGDDWQGFVAHTREDGGFFIATKPSKYPEDVAYAQVTSRPVFERAIPQRNVAGSVTLDCIGYKRP